jgi:hypothetical protein
VVLDGDTREVLGRRVVGVEVRAGHLGVHAREGGPRQAFPLGLAADAQPVLRDVAGHVRHDVETAREDDVGHAAPDRLDRLTHGVAAGGTGVLDPGAGHVVEADVLGHGRPGKAELATADAERSDDGFVDLVGRDGSLDVLPGGPEGLGEKVAVTPIRKGPEGRLAGTDDVGVSHARWVDWGEFIASEGTISGRPAVASPLR